MILVYNGNIEGYHSSLDLFKPDEQTYFWVHCDCHDPHGEEGEEVGDGLGGEAGEDEGDQARGYRRRACVTFP